MAGSDFHGYRRNVTDSPNVSLWIGEVTKAPANDSDLVTVRSLHGAGSEDLALGRASWPQARGKALPAVGDECLVAIDNQRRPWIVAWLAPGYPGYSIQSTAMIAARAAAGKIPNGFSKITLDTAIADPGAHLAGGCYLASIEGFYQVTGVLTATMPAKQAFMSAVYVSGSRKFDGDYRRHSEEQEVVSPFAGLVFCKAGEKIELWGYNANVGEVTLSPAEQTIRLCVARPA